MKNYDEMDEVELWRELANATPGSDEAMAIHYALRKFDDGLSFFDRHPLIFQQVGCVLVGIEIVCALIYKLTQWF